jgi:predicted nucleotidyltransferase component of viral defense system
MIKKEEIEVKAREFELHAANVERDYVFGWLLAGIYTISSLKDALILKGGNCFRKGYFLNTRFSNDLDFSTQSAISESFLCQELNKACDYAQDASGIVFEKDRNRVQEKMAIDKERKVYQATLYFKDFYGNPDNITISVRLDVTEFDRVYLPIQTRFLIHPYSDADTCRAEIKCVKLEELLATKLKCLLQRKHSFDLYDFVYSIFVNREIAVNRVEIAKTFLKKTIYEPSPGVAKGLLLGLPLELFRAIWNKYIICPKQSRLDFDETLSRFKEGIEDLFASFPTGFGHLAYFPANLRNPIIEAGSELTLLKLTYDGIQREVEPYSLVYKRRKDGYGQEYFYGYDRSGGRTSGPGIKCFVHDKIQAVEPTDQKYEPRFPIELSKAGEYGDKAYFGSPISSRTLRPSTRRVTHFKSGATYVIECNCCGKKFRRSKHDTRLNKHNDKYGNRCFGRIGHLVDTI